jgi:hypothetical protein
MDVDLLTLLALVVAFNFPHFYGIAENRLFIEHGEYLPGRHFRIYHLWLCLLFLGSSFFVYVLSRSLLLVACHFVYAPLGLDWVWWVIRYVDIEYRGVNTYDGGVGKSWHSQEDWDNYLGLPLVGGMYWWWWVCGILSLILGTCTSIGG